jgi:hypothetical protein
MTVGMFLLHLMGVHTSTALDALFMLVLGMGIGGVMQVLVIIVQNGVPHSELGVATSGATFFRSIGGSFGTAIFGAIFANVLVGNLASHLHGVTLPKGFTSADVTPAVLSHLPAAVHQGFVAGYAESIQTVFLVAVPIAALAFLATWFIPQVELKRWPEAGRGVARRVARRGDGNGERHDGFGGASGGTSAGGGRPHPNARMTMARLGLQRAVTGRPPLRIGWRCRTFGAPG